MEGWNGVEDHCYKNSQSDRSTEELCREMGIGDDDKPEPAVGSCDGSVGGSVAVVEVAGVVAVVVANVAPAGNDERENDGCSWDCGCQVERQTGAHLAILREIAMRNLRRVTSGMGHEGEGEVPSHHHWVHYCL